MLDSHQDSRILGDVEADGWIEEEKIAENK